MVDGLGKACGRTPFGRLARDGERWPGQVRRGERQERHERKIAGDWSGERKCVLVSLVSLFLPPAPGARCRSLSRNPLRSVEEAVRVHPTPGPGPLR